MSLEYRIYRPNQQVATTRAVPHWCNGRNGTWEGETRKVGEEYFFGFAIKRGPGRYSRGRVASAFMKFDGYKGEGLVTRALEYIANHPEPKNGLEIAICNLYVRYLLSRGTMVSNEYQRLSTPPPPAPGALRSRSSG